MARGKPKKLAGLRFAVHMRGVKGHDPREQEKRERQRQLQPHLRSRRQINTGSTPRTLRERLREPIHPWWQHLPSDQRNHIHQLRILRRRLFAWLKRKPQRIGLTVLAYALLCSLPLIWRLPLISLVALLPLLLVPPVGALVYWIVWQEFHT